MICPEHKVDLVPSRTKYGTRYGCPNSGCTVVCWEGSTSTPANQELRTLRSECHAVFDPIWKTYNNISRSDLYSALSAYMDLEKSKTHIGMFDIVQCNKVKQFINELTV